MLKLNGCVVALVLTTASSGCGGNGLGTRKSDGGPGLNGEGLDPEDATNVADGPAEMPATVDSGNLDDGLTTNTATGKLTGIGGDNGIYSAQWEGANRVLRPLQYSLQGVPYFHFTLDGNAWPTADWGLRADVWWVTCARGGELAGIGGDGKVYSDMWNAPNQMLQPIPSSYQGVKFFAFTLDGKPWPSSDWGIRADSWMIVCF